MPSPTFDHVDFIASDEIQQWIQKNQHVDVNKLLLSKPVFSEVSNQVLALQLQALQKAKTKLPTWAQTMGIVWPHVNNLAQSSSEATAMFKASLPKAKKIIDLTGGFGVDSWAFFKAGMQVAYLEKDPDLVALANNNFRHLNTDIQIIESDALQLQFNTFNDVDWVYADPLRRDDSGSRNYKPEDSLPNPAWVAEQALAAGKSVLIKLSPMASLPKLVEDFPNLSALYAVSLQHELKEILVICRPDYTEPPVFHAVQLLSQQETKQLSGTATQMLNRAKISLPLAYVFLPDASVLKTGLTDVLANEIGYAKLHHFSHVLTGEKPALNMPGRCFKLKEILPAEAKEIKKSIPDLKATLLLRDINISLEQIRKKTGLREGGEEMVLATSIHKNQWSLFWLESMGD